VGHNLAQENCICKHYLAYLPIDMNACTKEVDIGLFGTVARFITEILKLRKERNENEKEIPKEARVCNRRAWFD